MANITADQEVAARELLGWSRDDLARAARVKGVTIARLESGARASYRPTLARLRAVLEAQGIEFTESVHPDVKLKAAGSSIPA